MKSFWAVGVILLGLVFLVVDRNAAAGGTNWKRVVVAREVVIEPGESLLTDPIDVRGWDQVSWKITFSEGTDSGALLTATLLARNFSSEPFDRSGGEIVTQYSPSLATVPYLGIARRRDVVGAENRLFLREQLADQRIVVSISALLSR